jgi:hypothetical protein
MNIQGILGFWCAFHDHIANQTGDKSLHKLFILQFSKQVRREFLRVPVFSRAVPLRSSYESQN